MNGDTSAPVITIDGPGGTGKGTMTRWLAQKLDWNLLDSGALYRIIAWAYLENDFKNISEFIDNLNNILDMQYVAFKYQADGSEIISYKDENISKKLRSEQCAQQASILAAEKKVREFLVVCQRQFQQPPGLVADGRDMGTIIFPDAVVKLYLTASAEVRAKRRYLQLQKQGVEEDLNYLIKALQERDLRDTSRDVARLEAASDAVIIDTSDCSVEQVQAKIWQSVVSQGVV
jgi:CMP/dCMP kinase